MEKINIAELLKDCPSGMELDCTIFDNVSFVGLQDNSFPIIIHTPDGCKFLTHFGCYHNSCSAKCVIFPKGKTTWEGFTPLYKFKNGDVIIKNTFIAIISYIEPNGRIWYHCWYDTKYKECKIKTDFGIGCINDDDKIRFATEEEKARLFDTINANGYKWNPKTKVLEKLTKPQFKVGNVIQDKDGYKVRIIEVNIEDECYGYESMIAKGIGGIAFREQDNWELVPNKLVEPKFKVGDRITNGKTSITIGYIDNEYYYEVGRNIANRLFIKNQDEWNLIPKRFDINTLIPFESKVLVRHNKDNKWCGSFFSFIDRDFHSHCYKFVTTANKSYPMMIPYKGNEYLLGKTDDCQEFYKTWE